VSGVGEALEKGRWEDYVRVAEDVEAGVAVAGAIGVEDLGEGFVVNHVPCRHWRSGIRVKDV
jgi:hypothetical protein